MDIKAKTAARLKEICCNEGQKGNETVCQMGFEEQTVYKHLNSNENMKGYYGEQSNTFVCKPCLQFYTK